MKFSFSQNHLDQPVYGKTSFHKKATKPESLWLQGFQLCSFPIWLYMALPKKQNFFGDNK